MREWRITVPLPTYRELDEYLQRLGFVRERTAGGAIRYEHGASGAELLFPERPADEPLSAFHAASARGTLVDFGVVSEREARWFFEGWSYVESWLRQTDGTGEAPSRDWYWEGNVRRALVGWLRAHGWTIDQGATNGRGDDGVEVRAGLGPRSLAIAVKGYPAARFRRGASGGLDKRRSVRDAQGRTWFKLALATLVLRRPGLDPAELFLALPDLPPYRELVRACEPSLELIPCGVLFVDEDGRVVQALGRPVAAPRTVAGVAVHA
jgi:hypothetical protein